MTQTSLRVVTYNIHKGFSPGRVKFSLQKMREALAEVGADLVFLQEVQGEHKRQQKRLPESPESSQFEYLADTLWPHYAYGKNAIYQAGHHGNAILSKYPFITWENLNIATMARASRSLLHGLLELPGHKKPLHVICAHLGLFKTEREEQVEVLMERINDHVPATEPLILAGDFNDWRREATDALEDVLDLKEVFKETDGEYVKSFPAWGPTLCTDRIYYRGISLMDCECLNKKPWRTLSDHLPLLAKFGL